MSEQLSLLIYPLAALAATQMLARLARPLLRLRGRYGMLISVACAMPLLWTPLLVPSDQITGRALVSIFALAATVKMIDYAREFRRRPEITYADYLALLTPFPILLVRFAEKQRRLEPPAGWEEFPRMITGAAIVSAMALLLRPVAQIAAIRNNFPLDHAVKLVMFVVLIEAGSHMMHAIERMAGYDTVRPMQNFYRSLTPAEFWLRYNLRVHSWLDANVYRPAGGGARGVLAAFFVSACFHELMFDNATSHPDGTQFAFFMLQAPAVIASPALKRFADRHGIVGRELVRLLTIIWFYFTSMLFFRGVERVFPVMYASQPWLP
jgi:hypothetical protein